MFSIATDCRLVRKACRLRACGGAAQKEKTQWNSTTETKKHRMTAMVREIIRGDYLRLSEEWKREQAKKRAEEAKAKGGAE